MLVKNNRPTLIVLNECRLMPGVNTITTEQYKSNEDYIKTYVRHDYIEIVEGDVPSGSDETTLADYNTTNAVKIVKDTVDEELLSEWKEVETRKGVIKAIDAQMKKLEEMISVGSGSSKLATRDGHSEDGEE